MNQTSFELQTAPDKVFEEIARDCLNIYRGYNNDSRDHFRMETELKFDLVTVGEPADFVIRDHRTGFKLYAEPYTPKVTYKVGRMTDEEADAILFTKEVQ